MKDFEQKIVAEMPGLRRFARSLCRDGVAAEDLVQDCMARALAARRTWRGDNLRSWLTTIMINQFRNDRRRARSAPANQPIEDWQARLPDPSQGDPLEQNHLRAAINRLGADQRIVLMLVVIEGYRYEEVAAMLAVPVGTVMSRLSRARHALSEILKGENVVAFRRKP